MAALPTMMVSHPTPTLWWRKPAAVARPRSALTRSAATAVAVLALVGVARLGTARWGAAPDRPPFVSARNWAGAQAPQPGAADAATATAAVTATGDGDGDGRRAGLTAVTAANADAAAAVAAPATDADAVGECRAASLAYLLAHPKEFYAESGAWALKSALLAIRSALVDRPSAGAVATVAAAPPPPPLVVDVGANKGQNVPMWRAIYGDAAHLVLVEGNPAVATALAADFASKDDSVVVVQRLVGNATREMDFRVPTGQTNAERAAIQTEESVGLFVDQFNYVKLPVDTLDNIVANPELVPEGWVDPARKYPIDLLKTDLEGWDVVGLQGAHDILRRTRFVLWECHLLMALVNGPKTTHAQAAALLAAAGFESYKLSPQFVRFDGAYSLPELDDRANMGWHNCFAMRSDDPVRPELLSRFNHLFQCVKPFGLDG